MRGTATSRFVVLMAAALVLACPPVHAQRAQPAVVERPLAPPLAVAKGVAERAGMSSARLARIGEVMQREVTGERLPGAVVMIARRGRIVYQGAWGHQDPTKKTPMRLDSIFRIYSMTKPMVSVAAMMLVEDGVIQLTDPVSKFLPAFKDSKVSSGTAAADIAAERQMTVQDLLRHTAGLAYGEITKNQKVKDDLAKAGLVKPGVIDFDARDMTGAQQVERLAKVALVNQPGTTWEYSLASDLLGRVVEAAAGKRLGEVLDDRLFKPLKMADTAFWVSEGKLSRLAEPFAKDPASGNVNKLIDVTKQPGNDSGGAGAVSTARDYLRFAQMLLNGGVLEGSRVLSRSTIRLMTTDHLDASIRQPAQPGELLLGTKGYSFGLGFAVRQADGFAGVPGSAGEFMWAGYGGTYFWVDPKEQIAAVYMTQAPSPMRAYYRKLIKQLAYQALVD